MFRNLATSLIEREKFETTLPKAKDLRRVIEKLVTLARTDTLANRRQAYSYLQSKDSVHKLFVDVAPRYMDRKGGYTRVVRTRVRVGDAAEMAMIELIQDDAPKGGQAAAGKTKATSAKGKKKAAGASATEKSATGKSPAKKAAPKKAKAAAAKS